MMKLIHSSIHVGPKMARLSGNAFDSINEVTLLRVSTGMGDCLRAGKPTWYFTSHLGQLSLSSLRGR